MPRGFVNRRDRFRWDNVHFPDGENPLSSDSVTYDGQDLTSALDRLKEGVCFVDATPGASVTFTTADSVPLLKLTAAVTPVQTGSGEPAPDNVRPITGWSSCTITVTDGVTPTTYTINFGDAGTVYGGTLDVLTGKLTITAVYVKPSTITGTGYAAQTNGSVKNFALPVNAMQVPNSSRTVGIMNSMGFRESGYYYYTGTRMDSVSTPVNAFSISQYRTSVKVYALGAMTEEDFDDAIADLEIVYGIDPIEVQLTPQAVESLAGSNTVSASTGDITALTYQDTFTNEVNLIWQAISDLDARVSALEGNKSITPPPDDQRKTLTEEEPAEEIVEEQPVKKTTRKKTTE